jgi:hypothetical protein
MMLAVAKATGRADRLHVAISSPALGVRSRDEVTRIDDEGCGVFRPGAT